MGRNCKIVGKVERVNYVFLFILIFAQCSSNNAKTEVKNERSKLFASEIKNEATKPKNMEDTTKSISSKMKEFGLYDVSALDSTIWYDLKYHGADNFMKKQLYHSIDKPYLQKDVAMRLVKCSRLLRSRDSSLHLLIYDAVRPVEVQWGMWNGLDSIPVSKRVKFVSNPKNKSVHNYGAAVDITICRSDRKPLDMGAGYDDIREIAYPMKEQYFLSIGELTEEHIRNRRLLRTILSSEGFSNIQTEWWHFNACTRQTAIKKYKALEKEPVIQ
jgi:D-alanyl-D-alanine dipeptidase